MLTIIDNNLLTMADNGDFDIICHGANCFHRMASGIAGQIVKKWPKVAIADRQTKYGTRNKLGTFSEVDVVGSSGHKFKILNAYTQYTYGRGEDLFEYNSFGNFLKIFETFLRKVYVLAGADIKTRVGFPYIGCGLAGGDKQRIVEMIENFSVSCQDIADVTLVRFVRDMNSLQWLNVASCSAHRLSSLRFRGNSTSETKKGEKETLDMALAKVNTTILNRLRKQLPNPQG